MTGGRWGGGRGDDRDNEGDDRDNGDDGGDKGDGGNDGERREAGRFDLRDGEGREASHFDAYLYLIQMEAKASTATSLRDSTQIQLPKSKQERSWETKSTI